MTDNASVQSNLVKRLKGTVYHALEVVSPGLLYLISKRARTSSENWRYRAKMVRACPDYAHFSPVANAGTVVDGCQVMHNGLKVLVGSYYGEKASVLLAKTRGVHEPQEERVFEQILKLIKPGSVMIELGAYWSFYSMWFCMEVADAKPFLVEPIQANLEYGQKNFALNGFKGDFTRAYVGPASSTANDGTPVICVDNFVRDKGIQRIAILHCDIQGFELDMLRGADQVIRERRVDYYFISTHSERIHMECEAFLRQRGMKVITSISLAESFSVDGVLVCADPSALQLGPVNVSRRPTEN